MILTCPECSTRFNARDDAIGPNGRTVRCSKCSATWFAPAPDVQLTTPDEMALADMKEETVFSQPEETDVSGLEDKVEDAKASFGAAASSAAIAAPAAAPTADVLMRDKVDNEKRRARGRTIWLIWLIPLLLISAAFIALFLGRQTIAERFPGTVPFYNALGINVSTTGLKIENPTVRTADINGETTLIIDGAVSNIGKKSQSLPMLILSLHSPDGDEVATWQVELEKSMLRPKERLEFTSEYPNPPLDSVSLRYRLGE